MRIPEQPALNDQVLMGAGVFEHKMQFKPHGRGTLDGVQEMTELHAAVAPIDRGDDCAGLEVQSDKEVGRAVFQEVVRVTLRLARL